MSDLIDGRCPWAAATPEYRRYHDEEWGRPEHDSRALYEKLCLEAFQSGLSWLTILRKRDNFRRRFDGFAPDKLARWTPKRIEAAMADPGIVRNQAKIDATISNARVVADLADAGVDLGELLWSFAPPDRSTRARPASLADVAPVTPESTAMAKDLKKRGFRFVGPTTAYALMQATGMVDDHLAGCCVPPVER